MKKGFIYLLSCKNDNNVYIGQTRNNPYIRLASHLADCFRNKSNIEFGEWLRNIFTNHALPELTILEECPIEKLSEREYYWMDIYNKTHNIFNKTGKYYPEEVRKKVSDKFSEAVRMYDLKGNLLKEFTSSVEAAKELGVTADAIRHNCKGFTLVTKRKYIFKWKKDKFEYVNKEKRTRKHRRDHIIKATHKLTGEIKYFDNTLSFCSFSKRSRSYVLDIVNTNNTCANWYVSYVPRIKLINIDTGEIKWYRFPIDVSKDTNLTKYTVKIMCLNRNISKEGYKIEFYKVENNELVLSN